MRTCRSSERRCDRRLTLHGQPTTNRGCPWHTRVAGLILIALLSFWSGGCARRVVYVPSEHKLVKLEAGQPAPYAGVLLTEGYLGEIYEALGRGRLEPQMNTDGRR